MARSRYRSVRYDLDAAVALAAIVEHAGGEVGGDLLAPALGYSGVNNGAYLQRLASARLFGLVGGRGGRVSLTDAGRAVLAGGPAGQQARVDAFLSVPLFRAAVALGWDGPAPSADALARRMVDELGEPADRAPGSATRLLASAQQAGISSITSITPVDKFPSLTVVPGVAWSRTGTAKGASMEQDHGLWLDDDGTAPEVARRGRRRAETGRRVAVVAVVAACVAVVAVPVGLVLSGSRHAPSAERATHEGKGAAEHQVLAALSATSDSGSFNFSYQLSSTPPTAAPTTTTTQCSEETVVESTGSVRAAISSRAAASPEPAAGTVPATNATTVPPAIALPGSAPAASSSSSSSISASGTATSRSTIGADLKGLKGLAGTPGLHTVRQRVCFPGAPSVSPSVTGGGTIDTSPMAMVATAQIGGGLQVTVRVDDSTVYEDLGDLDGGLAPPASQDGASGSALSGFAGITESTLGNREGAVAMLGMASPTGYLDLSQGDITSASQIGTSTVNGVPVTVYRVSVDPSQLVDAPGISAEESSTISAAVGVLQSEGYTGTTEDVSLDAAGYILESKSVANFADGATAVLDATFSDFGCAGTVLMPGQQGSGTPPTNCTSPDRGAPTTTTTQAPATKRARPGTERVAPATPVPGGLSVPPMITAPTTVPGPGGGSTTTTGPSPVTTTTSVAPGTGTAPTTGTATQLAGG